MLLCKKIKIEVNDQDAEALEFMQTKCRALYNWWVMRLRSGERWNLESAKKSLRESKAYDPELRYVYGKLLAEVYFRLDKAMQAFFRRVAAGEQKPGVPRVKPRHQFFTLCYPEMHAATTLARSCMTMQRRITTMTSTSQARDQKDARDIPFAMTVSRLST